MFSDVLVALRRTSSVDGGRWSSPPTRSAQRIAGGHGATVLADDAAGPQRGRAVGIAHALEPGPSARCWSPATARCSTPAQLDALLAHAVGTRSVLIVPDRHGTGTNALLLHAARTALTPSFGPDSCERHVGDAAARGPRPRPSTSPRWRSTSTRRRISTRCAQRCETHGGAAHTRGMLSQLMRSRS